MIKIDGSYGEGGGQILRNTIALSTITKKPVRIVNIRANRPNPGIKAQHYVAIKSIQEICDAKVEGLEIGSSELTFYPGEIKGGKYKFDIGTAGSITLVLQACILASIQTKKPIRIRLTGGTDVKWSPTWDYFEHVFLPLIYKSGVDVKPQLIKRGYYPKGGGETEIEIQPTKKIKPLKLSNDQEFTEIKGIVHIGSLPENISIRIKHAVIKNLLKKAFMTSIEIDKSKTLSPGTGVTLWAESKDTVLGTAVLGERGVTSEEVGEKAALNMVKEIESGATLDVYAFDQILPYMVLACENDESSSCRVRELSTHASTNMWLLQHFFDVDFEAVQNETNIHIKIRQKHL